MNMATQATPRSDDETIEQEIVRKDCVHFIPEHSCDGGSLLPGAFFYQPALCNHPNGAKEIIDLVSGTHRVINMDCKFNRDSGDACGTEGAWFDPATLDGRPEMLEGR